jgi:hypothetical protein
MTNHNAANERIKHHYAACLANFLRHSGQSIDTAIKMAPGEIVQREEAVINAVAKRLIESM